MKFSNIIFVFSYAILAHSLELGSFYISKVAGESTHQKLMRASDGTSTIHFFVDEDISVWDASTRKCLNIDVSGKFTLSVRPRSGFRVTSASEPEKRYKLTFEGSDVFYLCDDDRVSISHTCTGARKIEISFKKSVWANSGADPNALEKAF